MTDHTAPRFAPVSLLKFTVMSLCSFGVYHVAWVYRQWKHEERHSAAPVSPFWRTFWAPLFIFDLLGRIRTAARAQGVKAAWNAPVIGTATVLLWAVAFLRQPWGLLSLFAFIPTLPVQRTVQNLNAQLTTAASRNDRFTAANIVLIVIGGLFLALVAASLFVTLPEVGQGTVDV